MRTILLKMAGPLQSWGSGSHYDDRHTDRHPTKSAIVGLLSAALGYRRDDERIKALNELDFAVRVDQQGKMLHDFQVAAGEYQKMKNGTLKELSASNKRIRRYISKRYYMSDATYVVAIGHADHEWIEEIHEALLAPYFALSMGRRAFPLTADFIIGVKDGDVIGTLKEHTWEGSTNVAREPDDLLPVYADYDLVESEYRQARQDRVESFSSEEKIYNTRIEGRIYVNSRDLAGAKLPETDHDVFAHIGSEKEELDFFGHI